MGRTVALVEPQHHVGGMTSSGLSHSDITTKTAIAGIFREFTNRVYRFYVDTYGADSENAKLSADGYAFEPAVAEKILLKMIADEPRIRLFLDYRLADVARDGRRI